MSYVDGAIVAFLTFAAAMMFWSNWEWRKKSKERHSAFMQNRIPKRWPPRCPQCGWDMDKAEPESRDTESA